MLCFLFFPYFVYYYLTSITLTRFTSLPSVKFFIKPLHLGWPGMVSSNSISSSAFFLLSFSGIGNGRRCLFWVLWLFVLVATLSTINCLWARNDTMNGIVHVNYITNHGPRCLPTGKPLARLCLHLIPRNCENKRGNIELWLLKCLLGCLVATQHDWRTRMTASKLGL